MTTRSSTRVSVCLDTFPQTKKENLPHRSSLSSGRKKKYLVFYWVSQVVMIHLSLFGEQKFWFWESGKPVRLFFSCGKKGIGKYGVSAVFPLLYRRNTSSSSQCLPASCKRRLRNHLSLYFSLGVLWLPLVPRFLW